MKKLNDWLNSTWLIKKLNGGLAKTEKKLSSVADGKFYFNEKYK